MRVFLILLVMVCIQNYVNAATNEQFAKLYSSKSVEHSELSRMTNDENSRMNKCVKETQEECEVYETNTSDESCYEVDFSEATDYCVQDVLGDIHN